MEFQLTGPERQDNYHRVVFNQENLRSLRIAINELLDIFHSILEKDFEYGSYFSHVDILNRLDEVELNHWSDIRKRFIEDEFHGYKNANFSDYELKDPAKLVLDFISQIMKVKDGISRKIEEKHHELILAEEKTEEYREKVNEAYERMMEERHKNSAKLLDAAKLQAELEYTKKLADEKGQKLAELQRTSSAALWEKEKEKLLKEANEKIAELEDELVLARQSTRSLSRKMSSLDDNNKLQKLKREMSGLNGSAQEVDKLKREIYMKDKDISHLEGELYEQQKIYVGMLAGLKTDINILGEKFYDTETCERDPKFVKLVNAIEQVITGAKNGELKNTKILLPPHYTFHDNEVQIRRIRRLSMCKSLPQPIPSIPRDTPPSSTPSVSHANGATKLSSNLAEISENPVIVDPKTDNLNGIVYLKYFSHMSRTFILDHWNKFKQYDMNGDRMLDLQEVVTLLKDLHCESPIDQIEEAMHEVDRDNSNSLDFYEYLLIVEKINRKSGNAKIFKQKLTRQNSQISKTCSIQ